MGIVIFVTLQLLTGVLSFKIKFDGFRKIYKHLGDSGFRIDHQKMTIKQTDDKDDIKNAIDFACFLIPGVNIINAIIRNNQNKKNFFERVEKYEALIPMNELEKKYYNSLHDTNKKVMFVSYNTAEYEKNEKIMMSQIQFGNEKNELKKNIVELYYDRLPAISFTLDEVKKLSEAVDSSYKLCKLDGVNTAIIGLPKTEYNIEKIVVKTNNRISNYIYEPIKEDQIENARFIVYPFGVDFNKNDELKACYEKLENDRKNYNKTEVEEVTSYHIYQNIDKPFVRTKKK